MVYRGLVLSLGKDYAVVMTDAAEYMKVNKKDGLAVGKRILFLDEDVYREKRTIGLYLIKCAAVFAIILLTSMFQLYLNEAGRAEKVIAAVVTIDINPSVELGINKKGAVVSLTSLNDEGAGISEKVKVGRNINAVLSELLENADAKEYLSGGENYILISLTALTDESSVSLADIRIAVNSIIEGWNKPEPINVVYTCGNESILLGARQNSISAGRYYYYEELKRSEPDITIDAVRNMKLKDLFYRQRYRQGYQSRNEAPGETLQIRQLTDDKSEHIIQLRRSHNMEEEKSTVTGSIYENQGNNIKGSEYQNRYQNMGNDQSELGENSNSGQGAQSMNITDEPEQKVPEPEMQQNRLQGPSDVIDDNAGTPTPQEKKPENGEPKENRKTEKGKKSETGKRQ